MQKLSADCAKISEFVSNAIGDRPYAYHIGSARLGREHPEYQLTKECANWLQRHGWALSSGGGYGSMAAASEGHTDCINVHISGLPNEATLNEFALLHNQPAIQADTFAGRKYALMSPEPQLVIATIGGIGTLDELLELLCLASVGHMKPMKIALLGATKEARLYWQSLTSLLESAISLRLADEPNCDMQRIANTYQLAKFVEEAD